MPRFKGVNNFGEESIAEIPNTGNASGDFTADYASIKAENDFKCKTPKIFKTLTQGDFSDQDESLSQAESIDVMAAQVESILTGKLVTDSLIDSRKTKQKIIMAAALAALYFL